LLFISLLSQSGNFWIHPRALNFSFRNVGIVKCDVSAVWALPPKPKKQTEDLDVRQNSAPLLVLGGGRWSACGVLRRRVSTDRVKKLEDMRYRGGSYPTAWPTTLTTTVVRRQIPSSVPNTPPIYHFTD